MWFSVITTLAILYYRDKEVVFTDIYNPNTSIPKIFDLVKPVDEWAEIAYSARQNAENEHCVTLEKLVHKLHFHH